MSHSPRIGFNVSPSEPYWVQVREAALQRAQELALDLIPIYTEDYPQILSDENQIALAEEILGQDFDAIIGWEFPHAPAYWILQAGAPIIHTTPGSYTRDVRAGSGYLSGDSPRVHFGFPAEAALQRLDIRWPGGAVSQVDTLASQVLLVIQR